MSSEEQCSFYLYSSATIILVSVSKSTINVSIGGDLRPLHGLGQWGRRLAETLGGQCCFKGGFSSGLTEMDGLRELGRIVRIQRYRHLCLIKGYQLCDLGEPRKLFA